MKIKHITTVAKIEAKLLRRSTTFKIICAVFFLIILVLVGYSHFGDFGNISPSVPGGLALKSFFCFSLIRMLISSFLAPVFIRDDRKMDSYKALSPRPFTNASYLFGKLIGFTGVMLAMDYFFMLILFVSSLLLPTVANSLWPYLLYPIIITLPLCVFLFGVNVFAAQIFYPLVYFIPFIMVTFFLPLGDLKTTYHLDVAGITLPLAYSAITGFYLGMWIVQRLIYVLMGLGFVWGACLLANFRRRGDKSRSILKPILRFLFLIFIFLGAAFCAWIVYIDAHQIEGSGRYAREFRNNKAPLHIDSCDIKVVHNETVLDVKTSLKITNLNDFPLEKFYLKHHVSFKTYNVVSKKGIEKYLNHYNSILIFPLTPLEPNESIDIEISDYGPILPSSSYFHIPGDILQRVHRSGLTTLGKQTAFVEHDYVLLIPDIDWYPTSFSKYQENEPGYAQRGLTKFTLEVTTHDGLTVISQGKKTDLGDNTYRFEPETPLTQMSLTIGPYHKASVVVDDVEYSYYSVRKNPFGNTEITGKDLVKSIRTVKEEIENYLHLEYPFKRYQIVETPIHFFGYNSPLDISSPYEQPEIKFIPESSIDFNLTVVHGTKANAEITFAQKIFPPLYRTKTNSRVISNKINLPSSIFSLGGLFQFATDPFEDKSNILTQYAVFSRGPVSDNDYFNLMAVNWLRSQFGYNRSGYEGVVAALYRSLDSAENHYFSTKSLKDILTDEQYFCEWMDILNLGSKTFFNLLAAKSGVDIARLENAMFSGFAQKDTDIAEELTKLCEMDVLKFFNEFSEQKEKAHYEISDMTLSRHFIYNRNLYNMRFKISNPTPYHGLVETYAYGWDADRSENMVVYIEPFTQKEIGLAAESEINILSVCWLPFGDDDGKKYYANNSNEYPVSIKTMDSDEIGFFEGMRDVQLGTVPAAVVMDNLSEGCRIVNPKEKKFIQGYVDKRKKNSTFVRFKNILENQKAPDSWTLYKSVLTGLRSYDLYGKYSSCYYTKAGNGDTAVEYTVPIPEKGTYGVYLSVPEKKDYMHNFGPLLETGVLGETTVRVFAGDGIHEDVTDIGKADGDWALVGTYSFADTIAVIQITDKTNAERVFADAVKLRKAD